MSDQSFIQAKILDSASVKTFMLDHCLSDIDKAASLMKSAFHSGKKFLWCGNGGSAADAQHLSTELLGGLMDHNRQAIPSIALTTDSSFLTAWANDTDFNSIFSRQIEALGSAGDILIGITTSGNSNNIIQAIHQAQVQNMQTIVLTGASGGEINGKADVTIQIPSDDTQRIQEGHILVGHILCELIENSVLGK
ncbi:MAG: SIS domain-containing protein [Candidatus Marinimicrobia bacterium]|nr:SIS domain-containing protein [Candidatus Neomarinimicrobiota bacterium]